jgi:signal transduction histidine kinase
MRSGTLYQRELTWSLPGKLQLTRFSVLHCADSIHDNLIEMHTVVHSLAFSNERTSCVTDEKINLLLAHISSSNESVETISTCSDHQRRLISDILSLSKLDSKLLQISPSPVFAMSLLENIRKMFQTEAERVGITLEIVADSSIYENNVGQVNLDSGRILQVLINLVSNAIKFTKNEPGPRHQIKVVMGASNVRPLDLPVDSFHNQESIYDTSESQDEFYLWFTVTDSGRGLSAEEKTRIFTRVRPICPRFPVKWSRTDVCVVCPRLQEDLQRVRWVRARPSHFETTCRIDEWTSRCVI